MALVRLIDVQIHNNPGSFLDDFQFEITFEASTDLPEDTEWKVIYVGSAQQEEHDQVLDSVLVGPVPTGTSKFVLETSSPNPDKIPKNELVGVTVVLLTCSYRGQEFIRVGYYVSVDFEDPALNENPPEDFEVHQLRRNILAAKPRVTRFPINWYGPGNDASGELVQAQVDQPLDGQEEAEADLMDEADDAQEPAAMEDEDEEDEDGVQDDDGDHDI
eukprot:m.22924 g.22924  ORF g.22924 m.22924 type:complete len:217 (+) comp8432_c0_seq1:255-905(+)